MLRKYQEGERPGNQRVSRKLVHGYIGSNDTLGENVNQRTAVHWGRRSTVFQATTQHIEEKAREYWF